MPVAVSHDILAPAERVWTVITDTRLWTAWGPSVTAVDTPTRFIYGGCTGRIRTRVGLWLDFEITEFEEGRYWAWRVARVPATGHRVAARDKGSSTLTFEVPIVAAPYALVCRAACQRIARIAEA